jgi:hypothetical protein
VIAKQVQYTHYSALNGPGKAPDGSTGTKCFINIPKQESGATFRLRIRRVAVASTAEMYGRNWTGDEYEVSWGSN